MQILCILLVVKFCFIIARLLKFIRAPKINPLMAKVNKPSDLITGCNKQLTTCPLQGM